MSPDRFRALFDHSSDAHLIFDERGITDCNDAAVALLGARDRREILALHPATLSPERQPDGRPSAEKSREMDALAVERGWHRFEWVHRRLDGSPVPVEVTLNAVTLDGRPTMLVVWHDLTHRKAMEAALREKAEALAAANAALLAANDRMRRELAAAALVQQSLLPARMPDVPGASFAWRFRPSGELAGDLLDVFVLDEHRVGFYVLDVVGHGAASSLLSVAVSHVLSPGADASFVRTRDAADPVAAPADVVRRLNRHFAGRALGQFFTVVYGVLDTVRGRLTFVTAGHPGPVVVPASGPPRALEAPALPAGILPDVAYEDTHLDLEPGDRVVVYSDGVVDARAPDGALFSDERLLDALRNGGRRDLAELLADVEERALRWVGGPTLQDDLSLVAFEWSGGPRRRPDPPRP